MGNITLVDTQSECRIFLTLADNEMFLGGTYEVVARDNGEHYSNGSIGVKCPDQQGEVANVTNSALKITQASVNALQAQIVSRDPVTVTLGSKMEAGDGGRAPGYQVSANVYKGQIINGGRPEWWIACCSESTVIMTYERDLYEIAGTELTSNSPVSVEWSWMNPDGEYEMVCDPSTGRGVIEVTARGHIVRQYGETNGGFVLFSRTGETVSFEVSPIDGGSVEISQGLPVGSRSGRVKWGDTVKAEAVPNCCYKFVRWDVVGDDNHNKDGSNAKKIEFAADPYYHPDPNDLCLLRGYSSSYVAVFEKCKTVGDDVLYDTGSGNPIFKVDDYGNDGLIFGMPEDGCNCSE